MRNKKQVRKNGTERGREDENIDRCLKKKENTKMKDIKKKRVFLKKKKDRDSEKESEEHNEKEKEGEMSTERKTNREKKERDLKE